MKNRTRKLFAGLMAATLTAVLIPGAASANILGMVTGDVEVDEVTVVSDLSGVVEGVLPAEADTEGALTIRNGTYTISVQGQQGTFAPDAEGISVETADGEAAKNVTLKDSLYYVPTEAVVEGSCTADAAVAVTHFTLEGAADGSALLKAYAGEQELDAENGLFLLIINSDANEAKAADEEESEPGASGNEAETGAPESGEQATEEFLTELVFENEEVVITVTAAEEAQLPMDTELAAEKLAEDSEAYIESKAAADAQSGSDPATTSYVFYSVKLLAGGEELHPDDGMLTMQIEFKNISADENASQDIVCIEDTAGGKVAENVASTAEGSTLSSVDFEL